METQNHISTNGRQDKTIPMARLSDMATTPYTHEIIDNEATT